MLNLSFFRGNKSFKRFLLSYVVIIIVTNSIAGIAYRESFNIIRKGALDANLSILRQCRDIVDARLVEVDSMVNQLILDPRVRGLQYGYQPINDADYYSIIDLCQKLPSFNTTNNFINDIFLYYKDIDLIVSRNSATTRMESFYKTLLNYQGLEYAKWKKTMNQKFHQKEYWPTRKIKRYNSAEEYVITYIQSFPFEYIKNPIGGFLQSGANGTLYTSIYTSMGGRGKESWCLFSTSY